ncbi:Extradiol ring-cleavage dioxygenase, class III enzyme, subunit B [Pseudocohnilembus persalinus]|uniref:Extradiol ring-cleavage dioxygenase, class III enzyme, subunit B n=1 Tax=Pseudocohnilembus persalinus TaxID=266149 RepID=A0A0V0QRL2_PSEPJ|nr:Extradiol ring-cleavage dioxygenase, class III enzyme, subunit B [Pseudocohnilembus persalinus]|eukprot:KRX04943.1 Extradiol ring-cleavage dioxygenase, class III enzyme, subunit B [Pseudocohnilembus persalinus]
MMNSQHCHLTKKQQEANEKNHSHQDQFAPLIFLSHAIPPILLDKQNPYHLALQKLGEFLSVFNFKGIIFISPQYIKSNNFYVTNKQEYITMQDHPYEEYFNFNYKAHGNNLMAQEIQEVMKLNNLIGKIDDQWGLDHGVWMPLSILFPNLQYFISQISIVQTQDLQNYDSLIKSIQELRKMNYLVICSGQDRDKKLIEYKKIPYFQDGNPLIDSFIPLYIALRVAQKSYAKPVYEELYKNCISLNCYIFEQ